MTSNTFPKVIFAAKGVQKRNDEAKTINEGSRHVELLREMNVRLHEFIRTKPLEEIKQMCMKFNNLYCKPPLDTKEFEKMWDDAVAHVTKQEMEKDALASNGTRTELISVAEAIRKNVGKVCREWTHCRYIFRDSGCKGDRI